MNNLMTVEYPDWLPDVLHMWRGETEREARPAMAVKLFENGKLTTGPVRQRKTATIKGLRPPNSNPSVPTPTVER